MPLGFNIGLRTKFIDYNARHNPKTDLFCVACQKDLNPNSNNYRWVHYVNGGMFALHPDDESAYISDAGDMGWFAIGLDCAKKLGLEWTHPQIPKI